jgi:hypothetical protein
MERDGVRVSMRVSWEGDRDTECWIEGAGGGIRVQFWKVVREAVTAWDAERRGLQRSKWRVSMVGAALAARAARNGASGSSSVGSEPVFVETGPIVAIVAWYGFGFDEMEPMQWKWIESRVAGDVG